MSPSSPFDRPPGAGLDDGPEYDGPEYDGPEYDGDGRPPEPPISREVDFGPGVLVAAVALLVLLVGAVLPWTATGASGWEVVLGAPGVTALPRLFAILALVFGVAGSVASILSRRWAVVFVTAAGCSVTAVTGVWAAWSQNTVPGEEVPQGPGLGIYLALLAMIVLAARWASYAFSRD